MNQSSYRDDELQCPLVEEKYKKIPVPPPLYSVYLQDTYQSTLDFIIDLVRLFFFFSYEKAVEIITGAQTKGGKIICGIYTRDVAETKVHQVNRYLRKYKCELKCGMEPV